MLAAFLPGCARVEQFYDSKLSLDQPVDWWHQLQGGPIADERPPPPGITDPYPNLARVPARPTPTDAATRNGLLAQLAAQRDSTRLRAAQEPIVFPGVFPGAPPPAPPPAQTKPAAPATATAPAPAPAAAATAADSDTSTMVLDAASAPAAPAKTAAAAPPPADPNPPAAFTQPPRSPGPVVGGPIPPLPTAAPPLPNVPNLPIATPVPVVTRPRPAAAFAFAPGSSAVPEAAEAALRALASRRAGGPIAIAAGGDARAMTPDAQAAALPLALRRTGAIAAILITAGVPTTAIRTQAEAAGREASARLVE